MYFKNLNDEEIKLYHNIVKTNLRINLRDAINSKLFKVTEVIEEELYNLVPLFNYDSCNSTGEFDVILDNQCILCIYNQDTVLLFESNDSFNDFNYIYIIKTLNGKKYINILFYDEITLMNIKGVEITVECVDSENNIVERGSGYSDINGGFIYRISDENIVSMLLKCNYSEKNKLINIEVD